MNWLIDWSDMENQTYSYVADMFVHHAEFPHKQAIRNTICELLENSHL